MMKKRIVIAVCTASLFVALPVFAQGRSGESHGNNSDHSGHDNDGKSAGHRKDAPHGFGDRNVVLSTPAQSAAVGTALTSVSSQLHSSSFRTSTGTMVPASAQSALYGLIVSDDNSPAANAVSTRLNTAGPAAGHFVPDLVNGLSTLRTQPGILPSVVSTFNDFTNAASPSFIANPPSEFLAIRAVLAQLTAAAASAK